jgi:hypothetical protein
MEKRKNLAQIAWKFGNWWGGGFIGWVPSAEIRPKFLLAKNGLGPSSEWQGD